MKIILTILLLAIVAQSRTLWHELEGYTFEKYQDEFNRKYTPEELSFRRELFERKLSEIRAHNADPTQTWKAGVNHFTDRTDEEFRTRLGLKKGLLYAQYEERLRDVKYQEIDVSALPVSVDWREKNIISPVKDQGDVVAAGRLLLRRLPKVIGLWLLENLIFYLNSKFWIVLLILTIVVVLEVAKEVLLN
jgi:cathepsin L